MYARRISMRLKPNSVAQFTKTEEKEVIPAIKKQQGFRDLIAFVSPSGTEAFVITLWEGRESADAYGRETYPRLIKSLENVVEGTPVLDGYDVSNSTYHKIAAAVA